jgi:hypothetical protein
MCIFTRHRGMVFERADMHSFNLLHVRTGTKSTGTIPDSNGACVLQARLRVNAVPTPAVLDIAS